MGSVVPRAECRLQEVLAAFRYGPRPQRRDEAVDAACVGRTVAEAPKEVRGQRRQFFEDEDVAFHHGRPEGEEVRRHRPQEQVRGGPGHRAAGPGWEHLEADVSPHRLGGAGAEAEPRHIPAVDEARHRRRRLVVPLRDQEVEDRGVCRLANHLQAVDTARTGGADARVDVQACPVEPSREVLGLHLCLASHLADDGEALAFAGRERVTQPGEFWNVLFETERFEILGFQTHVVSQVMERGRPRDHVVAQITDFAVDFERCWRVGHRLEHRLAVFIGVVHEHRDGPFHALQGRSADHVLDLLAVGPGTGADGDHHQILRAGWPAKGKALERRHEEQLQAGVVCHADSPIHERAGLLAGLDLEGDGLEVRGACDARPDGVSQEDVTIVLVVLAVRVIEEPPRTSRVRALGDDAEAGAQVGVAELRVLAEDARELLFERPRIEPRADRAPEPPAVAGEHHGAEVGVHLLDVRGGEPFRERSGDDSARA